MYKRFSIEELSTIKNNFIPHFASIMSKEKCLGLKEFLKHSFRQGDEVYFFSRGNPIRKLAQKQGYLKFVDEKDKIEVVCKEEQQNKISSLLKAYMTKRPSARIPKKSITKILWDAFSEGQYNTINGKPYIVYDIETSSNINDLKQTEFYLAYSMEPGPNNKMKYNYIDQAKLPAFVEKLLNFDGYVIGFNSIAFDNPVVIYNVGGTPEQIEQLNKKSLDIFLFIQNLTGRRIGLNRISQAFIGIKKTLDPTKEWENLWRQYKESGDESCLAEFKKYCKNDVRMTALVLFYLLHYKKIFREEKEIKYTLEDFIEKAIKKVKKINNIQKNSSIFE